MLCYQMLVFFILRHYLIKWPDRLSSPVTLFVNNDCLQKLCIQKQALTYHDSATVKTCFKKLFSTLNTFILQW